MFSTTTIESDTLQAYLETEYWVHASQPFRLLAGKPSADLLDAHQAHGASCSTFVTACNPFSQPLEHEANAIRQSDLADELTKRGLVFVPGIGQHPSNQWPGEDSYLVFGLELESAKALAIRLEQNAFIWSGENAVPQLILLK
ncbi:TPA: DUF3293 domain-containing protein [Pseudomonas aeruginosa]|nr:DUF3293 domain-containing protein [Pseudomonas aeruginosa]HBO4010639.1 DUF3293 domain-containing protein [Pseudomonas aeruginosa]